MHYLYSPYYHPPHTTIHYHHHLQVPQQVTGRRTAYFPFSSLCAKAYGPADYIELAKIFHVVFISDIPKMDMSHKNEVSGGLSI